MTENEEYIMGFVSKTRKEVGENNLYNNYCIIFFEIYKDLYTNDEHKEIVKVYKNINEFNDKILEDLSCLKNNNMPLFEMWKFE